MTRIFYRNNSVRPYELDPPEPTPTPPSTPYRHQILEIDRNDDLLRPPEPIPTAPTTPDNSISEAFQIQTRSPGQRGIISSLPSQRSNTLRDPNSFPRSFPALLDTANIPPKYVSRANYVNPDPPPPYSPRRRNNLHSIVGTIRRLSSRISSRKRTVPRGTVHVQDFTNQGNLDEQAIGR